MPNIAKVLRGGITRRFFLSRMVVLLLLLLLPGQARAQLETGSDTGQVFVLVRLTDYAGLTTYKAATPEEFIELASVAKKDNLALPAAYANLRKDWKKTQSKVEKRTVNNGGQSQQVDYKVPAPPFPLKCPAPREVKQMGRFSSAEALDKAKAPLEENEAKRLERLTKEKEAKEAAAAPRTDAMSNSTQDAFGFKRPPPRPSTKRSTRTRSVSPVSETEMLEKLIEEIERVKIENDTSGAVGGLRGAGSLTTMNQKAGADAKAGGKGGSKTGAKAIKRIGE